MFLLVSGIAAAGWGFVTFRQKSGTTDGNGDEVEKMIY
jgi:hypothetical protein